VLDAYGTSLARVSYGAWGEATAVGAAGVDAGREISYTGKTLDGSGLYYFNARYYAPRLGRFIAEDPAKDGGSWYSYCGGNPFGGTDPTGLAHERLGDDDCGGKSYENSDARLRQIEPNPEDTQAALDAAGFVPGPLGVVADAIGVVNQATHGNMIGAGISFASLFGLDFLKGLKAAGKGTTTLFRAVSPEEYAQLMKTGKFAEGTNSLGGKFFAESAADAAKWGDVFTKGQGGYRVISATVPDSAASQFMRWKSLDAIGPARYAELEQLNVPGLTIGTVK